LGRVTVNGFLKRGQIVGHFTLQAVGFDRVSVVADDVEAVDNTVAGQADVGGLAVRLLVDEEQIGVDRFPLSLVNSRGVTVGEVTGREVGRRYIDRAAFRCLDRQATVTGIDSGDGAAAPVEQAQSAVVPACETASPTAKARPPALARILSGEHVGGRRLQRSREGGVAWQPAFR